MKNLERIIKNNFIVTNKELVILLERLSEYDIASENDVLDIVDNELCNLYKE